MTALTAAQAARLEAIDWLVLRVMEPDLGHTTSRLADLTMQPHYRVKEATERLHVSGRIDRGEGGWHLAVAAIDVMRGAADDGAIGRVLALADELEREAATTAKHAACRCRRTRDGGGGRGVSETCECGHPLDRHDGIKTPTHDACAGGTSGFCGCTSYRPAPASASPVTNGECA